MLRRHALSLLPGAFAFAGRPALAPYLDSAHGHALLLDARSGEILAANYPGATAAEPPGSVLKPLVLAALLREGRLRDTEAFPCPGRLRLDGRPFDCVHPPLDAPLRVETALAYSCNNFVARVAGRFTPSELAGVCQRAGMRGVRPPPTAGAQSLLALGYEGVTATLEEIARSYRQLSRDAAHPSLAAIRRGVEGAVEYGTAQRASVAGMAIAGKTGTARAHAGDPVAWFAGWAPAALPEVVVAVRVRGNSGGADAAPVAAHILAAWRKGKL